MPLRTSALLLLISALSSAALLAGCRTSESADADYPMRPVVFTVPWNPGGGTDTASRALAAVLQDRLGQPVNVVNRTGGGGVVGHLALARARADGHTIGAFTVEATMMHHTGMTDLTYEAFTPLAMLVNNAAAVSVRADAPWEDVQDLVAELRANPGAHHASGTSRGGIWDLARIGFLRAAGLEETALPWVPSQGAAPAFQELLAGGVDVVTSALAEADALRRAGQVRVLGVMSDERLEAFPEVPTLKEQGIDWSLGGWVGVAAPAGLPPAVADTLAAAIRSAVEDPRYVEPLRQSGYQLAFMPADSFAAFIRAEDRRNGELLRTAGIAP